MLREKNKMKELKGKILYYIQVLLFFILIYHLIKKSESRKDNILIILLFIMTFIRNYKEKILLKINKEIIILSIVYLFYIIINYIFLSKHYKNIISMKMCDSLAKGLILFLIISQIKFDEKIKNIILPFILLGALNPIIKGLALIEKIGIFNPGRLTIWGNPNYYSMILGIFVIISLFSFFRYKNFIKILSCFIFGSSFFIILTLTQSKTTFLALLIVIILFNFEFLKGKYIKLKIISGILFFILLLFLWNKNARILTTFNLNHILYDGRLMLWNIGIEKFISERKYLFGLGIGYFSNNLIDFHGIKLGALHNDFIEILVTQGIIGFFLYCSLLFNLFKELYKKLLKNYFSRIGLYLLIYMILIGISDIANIALRVPQLIFLICALGLNKSLE